MLRKKIKNITSKREDNHNTSQVNSFFIYLNYYTTSNAEFKNFFHISKDNQGNSFVKRVEEKDIPENSKIYRSSNNDLVYKKSSSRLSRSKQNQEMKKLALGPNVPLKSIRKNEFYLSKKGKEIFDEEKNIRVAPLNILIDKVMKNKNKEPNKTKIISLILREKRESGMVLTAVSWVQNSLGLYSSKEFTVDIIDDFSDNVEEQVIEQVQTSLSNKGVDLPPESNQIDNIFIAEEELFAHVEKGLKKDTYPISSEIIGLPKNVVAISLLGLSGIVAFGSFSYNTVVTVSLNNARDRLEDINSRKPNVNQIRNDLIQNHVDYYLSDKSANYEDSFNAAEYLWLPYTTVELTQNQNTTRIRVFTDSNSMSEDNNFDPYYIVNLLEQQKAPEGYRKEPVMSSGAFLSYEVSYIKEQ